MIHDIVYHGNGGFDWDTVYNMPIWLRRFTYNRILNFLDEKNKANEKANTASNERKINFAAPPTDIKPGQRL